MSKAGVKETGLMDELSIRCIEFPQLEHAIQINLRGLGYGG